MPRPKVKPQDRQRSVRACDTCKASKKRCDANQPCRLCLKKGTQDSCTYTPTARDRRTRYSRSDTSYTTRRSVTAVDGTEDLSTNLASILTGTSAQRPRPQFGEPTRAAEDDADSETENIPESRDSVEGSTQKPVMLSSSSGDKGMRSPPCKPPIISQSQYPEPSLLVLSASCMMITEGGHKKIKPCLRDMSSFCR